MTGHLTGNASQERYAKEANWSKEAQQSVSCKTYPNYLSYIYTYTFTIYIKKNLWHYPCKRIELEQRQEEFFCMAETCQCKPN